MKSEERHELETNVLAKSIVNASDKLRPYTSHIVYGLLAIVAAWAIWNLSTRSLGSRDQAAWDAYATATLPGKFNAEELKVTASEYAGRTVGEMARIAWANRQLTEACFNYFSDKKASRLRLDDAEQAYRALASGASDPAIRERAQFGVARVLEVRGDFDDAIAAYQKVTGTFGELATARVKELEKLKPQVDATWLATAEGPARPPALGSGPRPNFGADDLQLPGGEGAATQGPPGSDNFLELLNQFQSQAKDGEGPDRYEERDAASSEDTAEGDKSSPQPGETDTSEEPNSEDTGDESPLGGLELDLTLPASEATPDPQETPIPEATPVPPDTETEDTETDPAEAEPAPNE